jgi:hypothetical protein
MSLFLDPLTQERGDDDYNKNTSGDDVESDKVMKNKLEIMSRKRMRT